MAKKKSEKKSRKKKVLKKKDSKKKDNKNKESKKKDPNKKKNIIGKKGKKHNKVKKESKKKKVIQKKEKSRKKTIAEPPVQVPVQKVVSDHSSDYNVRDAVTRLRTLDNLESVRAFTDGEKRMTVIKALRPLVIRLENQVN